jgi:hypothetical protein
VKEPAAASMDTTADPTAVRIHERQAASLMHINDAGRGPLKVIR